jgi:hypothetical protein
MERLVSDAFGDVRGNRCMPWRHESGPSPIAT